MERDDLSILKKLFPIIVLAYIAVRGYLLIIGPYNVDELSHVHLSYLHTQGWRFMIDDGDIARTPLLRYMLAPLTHVLGHESLLWYRVAISMLSYAALAILFLMVRRAAGTTSTAPIIATCFAFSMPFLIAAQQIRYEAFQLLFFLAALYIDPMNGHGKLRAFRGFASGLLIGMAVALKVLLAPYALSFWIVIFIKHRKQPLKEKYKSAVWPFLGMIIPFLLLCYFYRYLFVAIAQSTDGLFAAFTSSISSVTGGMFNITTFRYLVGQPIFWTIGLISATLLFTVFKRASRDLPELSILLLGTLIYFATVPFVKKQMYIQDLVFPALTAAMCIGYAVRYIRIPRAALVQAIVISALALEGLISSFYFTLAPLKELDHIRMKSYKIQEKVQSYPKPPAPGEIFFTIYKNITPYSYNYLMTRAEQDRGIQYFNRNVGDNETAIAPNSLNVFRKSPYAWSAGFVALADVGIDHLWRQNLNLPESFRQFYMCTNGIILGDPRMRGIEENLIRELDYFKPRVVLVDRFIVDIWFEYPSYLKLYDMNYEIRYDPESRLVFAHRRKGKWKYSELPLFEFWECAYDSIDRGDSPLAPPPESVMD